MKAALRYVVVALCAIVLSACSTLSGESTLSEQLAVRYAVAKVVQADPERAERVQNFAAEARTYVEGGAEVSVALLEAALRERIRWSQLDAADTMLVQAIITEARIRLEQDIGAGVLDAGQRVKLATVLDWIESAAQCPAGCGR